MLVPTGAEGKYEYDPSIPAGSGGGGGGGGGGGSLLCNAEFVSMEPMKLVLDKTFREIYTAAGTMPVFIKIFMDMGEQSVITTIFVNNLTCIPDQSFFAVNVDNQDVQQFVASSMDDYPVYEQ